MLGRLGLSDGSPVTTTHTYAIVEKNGRQYVEDQIVQVRRKPTDAEAFFLPTGHYKVETANGPIKVEAPLWILYDQAGMPYPITVEEFEKLYTVVDDTLSTYQVKVDDPDLTQAYEFEIVATDPDSARREATIRAMMVDERGLGQTATNYATIVESD